MVKIVEFFDNDIENQILPNLDFDVAEDLIIFMRNDPLFYRKSLFPAIETVRASKPMNTTALENVVRLGLKKYCNKFSIPHPQNELLTLEDVKSIVSRIIDEDIKGSKDGY